MADIIDLVSSEDESPQSLLKNSKIASSDIAKGSRALPSKPSKTAPKAVTSKSTAYHDDALSDDDLPTWPLAARSNSHIQSQPNMTEKPLTTDKVSKTNPHYSSDESILAGPFKPSAKKKLTTTSISTTSSSKFAVDGFKHLDSDDDPDEDPFAFPPPKKQRLSPLPKSQLPRIGIQQRSISNNESSSKPSRPRLPSMHRSRSAVAVQESDPLMFTSSPDPFADARKRKQRKSDFWDENNEELDAISARVSDYGNKAKAYELENSSDAEFPDLDGLVPKARQENFKAVAKSNDITSIAKKKAKERKDPSEKTAERLAAKEAREVAKEAEKEHKRIAKEEKTREKQRAANLEAANKLRTNKNISVKEMIVDLPNTLPVDITDGVQDHLDKREAKYARWESLVPIIKWRRKIIAEYNEEDGQFEPVEPYIREENYVMCFMQAEDFAKLVIAVEGKDLDAHVLHLRKTFETRTIVYLIQGMPAWFRKNRNTKDKEFKDAVRSHTDQNDTSASQRSKKKKAAQPAQYIDEDLIEDSLLKLQITHGVLIHHTNAWQESAEAILKFTEQISLKPYKEQRHALDTVFSMESGQVKAGSDPTDTFVKMLQELTRVTEPIARGIHKGYPSVQRLAQGFQEDGEFVLEDLRKSANKGGELADSRIGPAISKRLYRIFTSTDPSTMDVQMADK